MLQKAIDGWEGPDLTDGSTTLLHEGALMKVTVDTAIFSDLTFCRSPKGTTRSDTSICSTTFCCTASAC